jgi:hypothetical protein
VPVLEDWILPDFVRHVMDKEMELSLHQMMARLLAEMKAGSIELKADINAEMKAAQTEMEARAEARQERMEVAMNSMRSDLERSEQKRMEDVCRLWITKHRAFKWI